MFAVFSRETAMPPMGLLNLSDSEQQKTVHCSHASQQLEEFTSAHADNRTVDFGNGNGFSFSKNISCCQATDGHVSCLFKGQLESWPGLEEPAELSEGLDGTEKDKSEQSEASWLLAFYRLYQQPAHQGIAAKALANLALLEGRFAFILYDSATRRVLAARDRRGSETLFWGLTADGSLLFSTAREDLANCNPSATAFPSGSIFLSETKARAMQPGETGWMIGNQLLPGGLLSFVPRSSPAPYYPYRQVKAFPRINSKGSLCGAVYKVASESNMAEQSPTC